MFPSQPEREGWMFAQREEKLSSARPRVVQQADEALTPSELGLKTTKSSHHFQPP